MQKLNHTNKQLFAALLIVLVFVTGLSVQSALGNTAVSQTPLSTSTDSNQANSLAQTDIQQSVVPANCRYGAAALYGNQTVPWLDTLGSGWYVNFSINPPSTKPVNSGEYFYTLRMKDGDFDPPLSEIDSRLAADPGSLWFVGNEMEVDHPSTGDKTYPWDYARAYHEAYHYIKQRDPSAQVGIGGMSMATPMRLQYLDIVWDTYQQEYGVAMPVDVWNIHIYILSETKNFGNGNGDGRIALGTDPELGKRAPDGPAEEECPKDDVYCRAEHDSLEIFASQLTDLRRWMKEHGQQNKPLLLSEFSQLYQPGNNDEFGEGFPPSRVNAYMDATLNWLESAKDPEIGYPADENRLVQRWLWFSLYTQSGWSGYASNLLVNDYDRYPAGDMAALTSMGTNYRSHIAASSKTVNLKAGLAPAISASGSSATLKAGLRNTGTTNIAQPFQVTFYADEALTQVIGTTTVEPVINGCSWHRDSHTASVVWNGLTSGVYDFWAKMDSRNVINETNEADNVVKGVVFVNSDVPPTPPPGTPPSINWTAPTSNGGAYTIPSGATSVNLAATASDDNSVSSVRFTRWDPIVEQWLPIGEDTTAPYTSVVAVNELRSGYNQISATAIDNDGLQSQPQHIWLINNGGAGATPTAVPTATATPSPTPSTDPGPVVSIPNGLEALARRPIPVPIGFDHAGYDIATLLFTLEVDACLQFDTADENEDGVPDAIRHYVPNGFNLQVTPSGSDLLTFTVTRADGSNGTLPSGKLFDVTFVPSCEPVWGETLTVPVPFSQSQPLSFGSNANQIINGTAVDGSLRVQARNKAYLPIVFRID